MAVLPIARYRLEPENEKRLQSLLFSYTCILEIFTAAENWIILCSNGLTVFLFFFILLKVQTVYNSILSSVDE